jgi:hypothetical protein
MAYQFTILIGAEGKMRDAGLEGFGITEHTATEYPVTIRIGSFEHKLKTIRNGGYDLPYRSELFSHLPAILLRTMNWPKGWLKSSGLITLYCFLFICFSSKKLRNFILNCSKRAVRKEVLYEWFRESRTNNVFYTNPQVFYIDNHLEK